MRSYQVLIHRQSCKQTTMTGIPFSSIVLPGPYPAYSSSWVRAIFVLEHAWSSVGIEI